MSHYTDRPLGAAQLAELEDLHDALDDVLLCLARLEELLEQLVASQG